MNTILGIDIGKAKTGVARSWGRTLAQPLMVIYERDLYKLAEKIVELSKKEKAEMVVVGLPEGKLAPDARQLTKLAQEMGQKTMLWDETLTTKDANRQAIEANIPLHKRRKLEDAFAATILLQSYLDR